MLKNYVNERSKNSVLFEVNLIKYLGKRGFPRHRPLKNRKREYVRTYAHNPYVLYEFIEGSHLEEHDCGHKRQLIEKAALLHVLTRYYRPKYVKYRLNYDRVLFLRLAKKEARKIGNANADKKL